MPDQYVFQTLSDGIHILIHSSLALRTENEQETCERSISGEIKKNILRTKCTILFLFNAFISDSDSTSIFSAYRTTSSITNLTLSRHRITLAKEPTKLTLMKRMALRRHIDEHVDYTCNRNII